MDSQLLWENRNLDSSNEINPCNSVNDNVQYEIQTISLKKDIHDEKPIVYSIDEYIKLDDLYKLFKQKGSHVMEIYDGKLGNEEESKQLLEFLTQHDNIRRMIDYLVDDCHSDVLETVIYILTHSSNCNIMDEIVNNQDLLDYFFGKANEAKFPLLYDVYYFSLFRYPNCSILLSYFNTTIDGNNEHSENTDTSSTYTKGYYFVKTLCQNIRFTHIYRLLISLYTLMETPVPWYRELNFNVSLIMLDKLKEISSKPNNEINYSDYDEANQVIQFMSSITFIEALNMKSKIDQFIKLLVDIIFVPNPSPIAYLCLLYFNSLLSQTFNNQNYKNVQLPIILSSLLEKYESSVEFANRLYIIDYHLNNPVMQISKELFGTFRLKLIETVNLLIQTNYGLIHEELFKCGIMTSLLKKLFIKSDIIGNKVNEILQNILYCDDSNLVLKWMEESHLVELLIEGFEKHKHSIPRLVEICTKLKRVSQIVPQFENHLKSHEKWDENFENSLEYYLNQYKDLGNIYNIK